MDVELQALEIQLTPAARSAARIAFPVQRGRSATLCVLDALGQLLPPGTQLQLEGMARSFPVGLDGRAYLAGLVEGRNREVANWPDGHCRIELDLPRARGGDELPELGVLNCR